MSLNKKRKNFSIKNGRKNNHDLYRCLDYVPRLLEKLDQFFQVVSWERDREANVEMGLSKASGRQTLGY